MRGDGSGRHRSSGHRGGVGGQLAARPAAGDGDVRARGGHVADERVHLSRRARSGHNRQRRPVCDRAGSAGLGGVHSDREQGGRSDRAQARIRARAPRVCDRRLGDGAGTEPARGHHLLGDRRRPRRVAPASVHAVADPRQLLRRDAEEGLRAGRRRRSDRRRRRAADRRVHHDLPLLARRGSSS